MGASTVKRSGLKEALVQLFRMCSLHSYIMPTSAFIALNRLSIVSLVSSMWARKVSCVSKFTPRTVSSCTYSRTKSSSDFGSLSTLYPSPHTQTLTGYTIFRFLPHLTEVGDFFDERWDVKLPLKKVCSTRYPQSE